MKNKWTLFGVILFFIAIVILGCNKRESTKEEMYKSFQERIYKVKSYKCRADIDVLGNKSSHEYSVIHEYNDKLNFKLTFIEPNHLKGKVIEYKNNDIIVKNEGIKDEFKVPNSQKDSQHLFIGDFVKNYLQGEDVEIEMSDGYLALSVDMPGNTKYFNKQILYVNTKENYPAKLEILDQDGNSRFKVNYSNFEY